MDVLVKDLPDIFSKGHLIRLVCTIFIDMLNVFHLTVELEQVGKSLCLRIIDFKVAIK